MKREAGQLWVVARYVFGPACRFLWKFEINGLENVPTEGPAIMAPNHVSVIDSFYLPAVLDRRITYVGKAEYMDSWKTKYLFPALGMVPIDRSGGKASQAALDTAARILDAGELFGIYPEGTRTPPGQKRPYHPGVAALYKQLDLPVVPVALNSGPYWGRRSFSKRAGTILVEFLEPIQPGLERKAFMAELERRIETATDRLIAEAKES